MIFINVNQSNTVDLNLQSNSKIWYNTATQPYYLFCFSSDTTHQIIYFVGNNISPFSARPRYDSFVIIETGSTFQNLSASTLYLNPGISWTYVVMEQTSQFNFDPTLTSGIVDQGKVYVSGFTTTFQNHFYTGGTTNYYVYNTN